MGSEQAAELRDEDSSLIHSKILYNMGLDLLMAESIIISNRSNSSQLEYCLLVTHHVFREVTPDVFTNNRISSVIDQGKPSELLFEKTGEGFKSSVYMTDALLDSATAFSRDPTATCFSRSFSTEAQIFGWFESPENKERLARFGIGQVGTTKLESNRCVCRTRYPMAGCAHRVAVGEQHASGAHANRLASASVVRNSDAPSLVAVLPRLAHRHKTELRASGIRDAEAQIGLGLSRFVRRD
ncbi:hypothetical protein DFH08DRAFT_811747 [Mycena albidolilacea]|uniref:Uncharacterized protein n=1 Tax=Mycena albidolilacea TaxID=1033008 RepID=A0AAD6ZW45_9AGAR|nr:hypothetical protein DFH08DRAFT_811747 [Mycena albidolilacea]